MTKIKTSRSTPQWIKDVIELVDGRRPLSFVLMISLDGEPVCEKQFGYIPSAKQIAEWLLLHKIYWTNWLRLEKFARKLLEKSEIKCQRETVNFYIYHGYLR